MLQELIAKDPQGFKNLCRQHKVSSLYAFGSSVSGSFNANSDVDLIVDFNTKDPLVFGDMLLSIWDRLEVFFGRKVDLLTMRSVRNPVMRREIEKNQVLVYDGANGQILV